MTPYLFGKGSVCKNSLGGDMHSHERLLAISAFVHCVSVCVQWTGQSDQLKI